MDDEPSHVDINSQHNPHYSNSPGGSRKPQSHLSNPSPTPTSRSPPVDHRQKQFGGLPGVVCYICGRNYGSTSIGIHVKTCLARWKEENDARPKHLRRPVPVPPEVAMASQDVGTSGSPDGKYSLKDVNEAAFQSYQDQMVKCQKCERTFLPDRLQIHVKCCNGVTYKRCK